MWSKHVFLHFSASKTRTKIHVVLMPYYDKNLLIRADVKHKKAQHKCWASTDFSSVFIYNRRSKTAIMPRYFGVQMDEEIVILPIVDVISIQVLKLNQCRMKKMSSRMMSASVSLPFSTPLSLTSVSRSFPMMSIVFIAL